MLQGIATYCGHNLPGTTTIEYLPTSWVDSAAYELLPDSDNLVEDIPLNGDGPWLPLPVLPNRQNWNESERKSDQGPSWEQSLQAITVHLRPSVTGEFARMSRYRFLVRLTDKSGLQWLLGTLDQPLEFSSSGEVGEGQSGLNHYQISFTGSTSQRAYGFVTP